MTEAEFTAHYKASRGIVLLYIARLLRSDTFSAQDFAQSAWLKAWKKRHQFKGNSRFSTWVCTIARNEIGMWFRKRVNREEAMQVVTISTTDSFGDAEDTKEKHVYFFTPRRNDPRLATFAERTDLYNAIGKLPPGYKHAFIEKGLLGMRLKEMATVHNVCIGTAKSQLHKARRQLVAAAQ